ncbi:phosphoesterase [Microbispora sp. H11081]|uniref:phosphoesterase n=1 Tax=Microbispora sp. H11081 TaxID=2729107 RepID=UPI0014749B97|nr:phosphoesterase [Microbispora sp. H11081]
MPGSDDQRQAPALLTRRRLLAVTGGLVGAVAVSGLAGPAWAGAGLPRGRRQWLAGDHHVHSEFSVGYDNSTTPPTPIIAGDAIYPLAVNAANAEKFGLAWIVSTDHGGPQHSKLDAEKRYPSLLEARRKVPGVLQFYGMELDTPAADHSSLIIPKVAAERDILFDLESRFSSRDPFPADPAFNTEQKMLEALRVMSQLPQKPLLFANHPARSASGLGVYGQDTPAEFRNWNDTAPDIAHGFEGAPGHQAGTLNRDGTINPNGSRGGYGNYPTMGGFDQMTARLGGLWDSLLGEGRRWWITSTSDSHVHYHDGGSDFWPGEYSKTYVYAGWDYADILDALRNGRIFVTLGDLIDQLDLTVRRAGKAPQHAEANGSSATVGETLTLRGRDRDAEIEVRVREPRTPNASGQRPHVNRIDIITGRVTGPAADRSSDTNPTTAVAGRYGPGQWSREGDEIVVRHTLRDIDGPMYVRVRGTNTDELEPQPDPRGSDPWSDLWFYSNPVFIDR